MKKNHLLFIFVFVGVLGYLHLSIQADAQRGVIDYLYNRFKEQNIPIKEIEVLENNPLHLLIVIQGAGDPQMKNYYTMMMRSIDRELQIYAPQQGYFVDSYTRVILDSQGNKIDKTSFLHIDYEEFSSLNLSQATLTDKVVQNIVSEKIRQFMIEYPLYYIDEEKITINVVSEDNYQILRLDAKTNSSEEASRMAFFLWNLPSFPLLSIVNEQGAQIVLYQAKVVDENGKSMFDFTYDLQLGSGSWSIDPQLENPSGGSPPPEP